MRVALVVLVASGLGYFLFARRKFDLFSLGFFSSCLYFLPGLFGFVQRPTEDLLPPKEAPLAAEAYAIYCLVLFAVLAGGVLLDRVAWRSASRLHLRIPGPGPVALVSLGLAYVGLFFVVSLGQKLLEPDKAVLLQSLDRWHAVLTTFATIAAVAGVAARRWAIVAASVPLFALDLFLGTRTTTALAMMAAILVWLAPQPASRAIPQHRRLALVAAAMAFVFFGWQQLFPQLRVGNWSELVRRAATPSTYRTALVQSEPFTTQAILNEVLRKDYRVPAGHLLDVAALALPFYTEFFDKPSSFNDFFQHDLFPGIRRSGLANNFWAQAIAAGGYVLLLTYIGLYVAVLAVGSLALRSSSPHVQAMAAIGGAYFAFYVHRNDLLFELLLERRFLGAYLGAVLLAALLIRPSRRAAGAAGEGAT